jgi:small subunit ribosomal protein S17
MTIERNYRKTRTGLVVSDAADKTISVRIERIVRHPLYGRVIKRRSKLLVHDETNDARIGDRVEVMETRPLSKSKRWRLTKVVERAK